MSYGPISPELNALIPDGAVLMPIEEVERFAGLEDEIRRLSGENDDLVRDLEKANDKLDSARNHFDWIASRCDDALKEANK